jgi:hypothetical protein
LVLARRRSGNASGRLPERNCSQSRILQRDYESSHSNRHGGGKGALVFSGRSRFVHVLSYRCFVAKGRERVPLFGDFGLVNQLGSSDYARPRKFRERLEGWLDLVRSMWPECPAAMDTTGTGVWVDRATAVLPAGGK